MVRFEHTPLNSTGLNRAAAASLTSACIATTAGTPVPTIAWARPENGSVGAPRPPAQMLSTTRRRRRARPSSLARTCAGTRSVLPSSRSSSTAPTPFSYTPCATRSSAAGVSALRSSQSRSCSRDARGDPDPGGQPRWSTLTVMFGSAASSCWSSRFGSTADRSRSSGRATTTNSENPSRSSSGVGTRPGPSGPPTTDRTSEPSEDSASCCNGLSTGAQSVSKGMPLSSGGRSRRTRSPRACLRASSKLSSRHLSRSPKSRVKTSRPSFRMRSTIGSACDGCPNSSWSRSLNRSQKTTDCRSSCTTAAAGTGPLTNTT